MVVESDDRPRLRPMIYLRVGVAMLIAIALEAAVHDLTPGESLHGETHGIG